MMMINSSSLQSDSGKRLRLTAPRNNKNDLLISSTSENLDDINNNHQEQSPIDCNNIIKQQSLTSNDNENDTTLLTTTTTTTTVEVKVKTTKTSRKRKLNVMNDINNDNISKQQVVTKRKKKPRMTKVDDESSLIISPTDDNKSKTVDQSSVTDESSFGSCEPGSSVVLEGIIWNETDKGVLVVNITWRGKTYVGALLNTTEQNWAPPRYKPDVRSTKPNHNREYQIPPPVASHEPTERILRNGKRRGSSTPVTPNSTTKTNSFKIPPTPPSKIDEKLVDHSNGIPSTSVNDEDEINSIMEEKTLIRNTIDDETGDNCSSRSISPTTSGTSTTSSSPPLSNNIEHQSSSIPIDLSNSKATINVEQETSLNTKESLIPYHFINDMLFPSPANSSSYFPSHPPPPSYLHGSTNSFSLPLHSNNNTNNRSTTSSSAVSPSSYLPIPSQLYFNSLTTPHYSSVSSLSKSSH